MDNVAQLTIVEGSHDYLEQVFLLTPKHDRILGRSSTCHFQIEDPLISSLHCYFCYENQEFVVYDLLSANGVLVDKRLVDFMILKEGSCIKVGKTVLVFSRFTGEKTNQHHASLRESTVKTTTLPITTLGRMIKKQQDLNICRLALKNKLITHDEIRELLRLQKDKLKTNKEVDLQELLIQKNKLSEDNITKLLQEHNYYKIRNKDLHFGKIIVDQNLVTEDRVAQCLSIQDHYFQQTGQMPRLGEVLVQKGYMTVKQNNRVIKLLMKQKLRD